MVEVCHSISSLALMPSDDASVSTSSPSYRTSMSMSRGVPMSAAAGVYAASTSTALVVAVGESKVTSTVRAAATTSVWCSSGVADSAA